MKCIMFQINNIVIKTNDFWEQNLKKKKKRQNCGCPMKGVIFKELDTREKR